MSSLCDAVPGEVVAQKPRCKRLVPGGIDRVETDQCLEKLRHLLTKACCLLHGHRYESAFDSAVRSLRTSQSSGNDVFAMSRPSNSTGVPCVPTT